MFRSQILAIIRLYNVIHTPHTCEISYLHFPPCTLYTHLQMHVYLIDKFLLYNLMMAKICGRNM